MKNRGQEPVLIVGAGPVGLTMGCELARQGVDFRIIDKEKCAIALSKAVGLHARSLEVLDDMGVLSPILDQGVVVKKVNFFHKNKRLANIEFSHLNSPFPFLLDLPQFKTEKILSDHLQLLEHQVERLTELVSFKRHKDYLDITLNHLNGGDEHIKVPWLICCEGAHSFTRNVLGLEFEGKQYEGNFTAADVLINLDIEDNEVGLWFDDLGVVALFPLGERRYRVVCETSSISHHTTREELIEIVQKRIGKEIEKIDKKSISDFQINRRQIRNYRNDRIFLLGDAAHVHSPAGGQGLNTGIQDAYNLAWKLALVLKGRVNEKILNSFDLERRPVGERVLKISEKMTKVATIKNGFKKGIRNFLVKLLGKSSTFKEKLTLTLSEVGINYRKSPLVEKKTNLWMHKFIKPGDRAPFGKVVSLEDGKEQTIYHLLKGTKLKLLIFSGEHSNQRDLANIREILAKVKRHLVDVIDIYVIVTGHQSPDLLKNEGEVWFDKDKKLHKLYGASLPSLYLIRPDGYINFINKPPSFKCLQEHLKEKLCFV